MTTNDGPILGFCIMVAAGSAVAAAISFQAWIDFGLGVVSALVGAAIASIDFE